MPKTTFLLITFLLFISCTEESGSDNQVQPSNLVVNISESEEEPGLITVEVTADNASFYSIDFGLGAEFERTNDGIISKLYTVEGDYSIKIRAHANDNLFVEESIQLNVSFDKNETITNQGYSTPLSYSDFNLVWQDEFNGTSLDESDWNYEVNGNGGGNNELQFYRKENTSVADGFLVIEARNENFSGKSYTSSRLTTQNKVDFKYGRVDIRAILPKGQGLWPALWMLGSNFATVGWPKCGEIDIMEMIGGGSGRDDTTHGTIHWDNNGTKADYGGKTQLSSGIFNDKFYVFSIVWDAQKIQWLLNDQQFHVTDITPAALSEFQNNFFFILNVAVGGNWPGKDGSGLCKSISKVNM
jgi:hypothetical protein